MHSVRRPFPVHHLWWRKGGHCVRASDCMSPCWLLSVLRCGSALGAPPVPACCLVRVCEAALLHPALAAYFVRLGSVFDLRGGRVRETLPAAHKRGVRALALDPYHRWFASGSAHGDVKVSHGHSASDALMLHPVLTHQAPTYSAGVGCARIDTSRATFAWMHA